jgi:hypothetical protein
VALPDTPPLVAVTVTTPSESALTTPVADTFTAMVSLLRQATGRLGSTFPALSRTEATNGRLVPMTITWLDGVTITRSTGVGAVAS